MKLSKETQKAYENQEQAMIKKDQLLAKVFFEVEKSGSDIRIYLYERKIYHTLAAINNPKQYEYIPHPSTITSGCMITDRAFADTLEHFGVRDADKKYSNAVKKYLKLLEAELSS